MRIIGFGYKAGEGIKIAVKAVEAPAVGSNPQITFAILKERENVVDADAIGIFGIIFINLEVVPIIAVQTILCAKPHKPFTVLKDGRNHAL